MNLIPRVCKTARRNLFAYYRVSQKKCPHQTLEDIYLRWLDTVLLKIDSFTKPQNSSTNFYSITLCWMRKVFT